MLLNEKFEMDNWTSKDYDKIIQKILRDDNPNLQGYVKNCPDIQQLNLPKTLQKRSEFTYYHYENEIELIKGSKIFVENIYRYNILKNKWIKYTVNNYYKV